MIVVESAESMLFMSIFLCVHVNTKRIIALISVVRQLGRDSDTILVLYSHKQTSCIYNILIFVDSRYVSLSCIYCILKWYTQLIVKY